MVEIMVQNEENRKEGEYSTKETCEEEVEQHEEDGSGWGKLQVKNKDATLTVEDEDAYEAGSDSFFAARGW